MSLHRQLQQVRAYIIIPNKLFIEIVSFLAPSQHAQRLARKHFSKSASELNGHDCGLDSPQNSPQRAKSAAQQPTGGGVFNKTHGFFSTLKHRWGRAKSKERLGGRKSPNDGLEESTDYAADYSSESSSVTHSPRHRATTVSGLPTIKDIMLGSKNRAISMEETSKNFNGEKVTMSALEVLQEEDKKRKRESQLRKYVFFQLRIHLKCGTNLVAMDKNGLSDPYVKFKIGGRLIHKSKTIHRELNPIWDEVFVTPIEDPFLPINIKVFDYDWGLQDDFMGSTKIFLPDLELGKLEELVLPLEDSNHPENYLGEISLSATLWPRSQEDKELVSVF